MPQKRRPPRLWYRAQTGQYYIKDGERRIPTGCGLDESGVAQQALEEYRQSLVQIQYGGAARVIKVLDVVSVYQQEKADQTSRPNETIAALKRVNDFFGTMAVADIRGKTCRDFADRRKTEAGARRDLEVLRAAVRYYHREYGLDVVPAFTLPPKSQPRDDYLTRKQAALLLWACLGFERKRDDQGKLIEPVKWIRRLDQKRSHVARLVLIGIYTGTRPGAILKLQWRPNLEGGHVDMEQGVIHRRAKGERVAHNKRKTPVKVSRKLMVHLRIWKKKDKGLRYVVHYQGEPITKINKAWRSARGACLLPDSIVPHTLRHTRGTWLAQAGVPSTEAAASLGLTVEEYERTYLHNDPSFQKQAADAY